jgi:cyclophilin family peptidyl-prolyl cis-trans isomerase
MTTSSCAFLIASFLTLSCLPVAVRAQRLVDDPSLIVVETSKGSFLIETFPDEAPVSVAHFTDLVRSGFYDGQRIHRAEPSFVVQFGDPRSRDLDLREVWGRGADAGSGRIVGTAELGGRLSHTMGTVGLAHMGLPARADSQIYITLANRPELDERYAIVGRLVAGHDVLSTLRVGDVVRRMYVKD